MTSAIHHSYFEVLVTRVLVDIHCFASPFGTSCDRKREIKGQHLIVTSSRNAAQTARTAVRATLSTGTVGPFCRGVLGLQHGH